jgi:murein DD-endopeptidase MepM/ murein hydrolase activator NlpD
MSLARCRAPAVAVLLAGLAVLTPPGSAAAAGWRAPVDGPVVARFALGADRFAAGQRRGIELAAAPGTVVRAPCAGTVTFAGRLPRRGGGVAIRCGRLVATVLGLEAPVVRRGEAVRVGDALGPAGTRGRVHLGARRAGDRFAYRDPEPLLDGGAGRPAPPLVAPRRPGGGRRAARGPRGRALRPPAAAPRRVLLPPRAPVSARATVPLAAWAGLALVAVALPTGAVAARPARRRRGRARAAAVAR